MKSSAQIRSARAFPGKMGRIPLSAPLATVTFDDFPRNALTAGAEIVEAAGGRATFFASGGLCGQTFDGVEYYSESDLFEAHSRGHEIGCHTFSHKALPKLSRREIDIELKKNLEFIQRTTGRDHVSSFAYPYGSASIRTKLMLGTRFLASRGIEPGVNSGLADFSQLRAVSLEPHVLNSHPIPHLVERTCSQNGWLILICHDVSRQPTPYGCTPELLEKAVSAIKNGGIELVTVEQALARMGIGAVENSNCPQSDCASIAGGAAADL